VRPETEALIAIVVVAAALVGLAIAFQRGDRTLRARLVVLFVALSLSPSLLTLGILWHEIGPRARVQSSAGVGRSLGAALVLARAQIAAHQTEAHALAQANDVDSPAGVVRVVYDRAGRRVLHSRGWPVPAAVAFLSQPDLDWPAVLPTARVWRAPDSTTVAIGIAPRADSTWVLVARALPRAESAALDAVVEGVRQSQRLGYLEDLRLTTAARLLGIAALVWAAFDHAAGRTPASGFRCRRAR
jgi:hypothetical protein